MQLDSVTELSMTQFDHARDLKIERARSTSSNCIVSVENYTELNCHFMTSNLKSRNLIFLIAELRRPEWPPSGGAPDSYRKEKETHELIFSWLPWLAV